MAVARRRFRREQIRAVEFGDKIFVREIQRLRIVIGDKNKNEWQLKDLQGCFLDVWQIKELRTGICERDEGMARCAWD
jgi:hypothetical protein